VVLENDRWPQKVSYRTLSIPSLNIDQFSHFFHQWSVDSVRNLLLIGIHTTPNNMSLHILVGPVTKKVTQKPPTLSELVSHRKLSWIERWVSMIKMKLM